MVCALAELYMYNKVTEKRKNRSKTLIFHSNLSHMGIFELRIEFCIQKHQNPCASCLFRFTSQKSGIPLWSTSGFFSFFTYKFEIFEYFKVSSCSEFNFESFHNVHLSVCISVSEIFENNWFLKTLTCRISVKSQYKVKKKYITIFLSLRSTKWAINC
jgi:hypothetical protein